MKDIGRIIEEAKAEIMPFESWERLTGESAGAYSAFCAYRDYGPERNIRKAAEAYGVKRGEAYGTVGEKPERIEKRCRMWRNWAPV
jgi:hypothetical protein